ncbi:hypothetical protein JHD46_06955 [Sulfurimonas sp. SAG-AH-194-C20]|nr:hypothetical protein [Sulfurimonas sp. SAG-AH-194-C20]MDF1879374.1 hypothetical protein [Sulfurimonas sp. SAG-AH-194-C20]
MKTFLTINILLLLFSACSYDNAFSRFNISEKRAKSEESIVSSKIYNAKSIAGVMSCVYLNKIDPEEYKDGEYFYIYLYQKDINLKINFTLNDINASQVKELTANNKFTVLTDSNLTWQKYYLVKFKHQDSNLTLIAKFSSFESDAIVFQKSN